MQRRDFGHFVFPYDDPGYFCAGCHKHLQIAPGYDAHTSPIGHLNRLPPSVRSIIERLRLVNPRLFLPHPEAPLGQGLVIEAFCNVACAMPNVCRSPTYQIVFPPDSPKAEP